MNRCPRCHTRLDEGPILFRCNTCRRAIYAADLDCEFRPTNPIHPDGRHGSCRRQ